VQEYRQPLLVFGGRAFGGAGNGLAVENPAVQLYGLG
jgi:hypothetical protein